MPDATALTFVFAALAGAGVSTVGGFVVGYQMAASRPARLLRRAGRETRLCLSEAAGAIDLAQRFCDAASNTAKVAHDQVTALAERQRGLAESIGRLLSAARCGARPVVNVEWEMSPIDSHTQLPDRAAFDANVGRLAAASQEPRGGVLLLSLDGITRLRNRVGVAETAEVRRTVARVLCRAGRERDLACVVDDEAFVVLLPDAEPDDALRHASAIRDAFRGHPFRIGADGPEVLVTASYGFTPVLPGDDSGLVLDRVGAAVSRARRWGRSRFYAYEPVASRIVQVPEASAAKPAVVVSA